MAYLLSEILLSLIGAALLGGIAGWQLCRWKMTRQAAASADQR